MTRTEPPSPSARHSVDQALAEVWRAEWGRLLAMLLSHTRRLDLTEDALAEAFETAARRWPTEGIPENPAAWLLTTSRRRVIDRIRAEAVAARSMPQLIVAESARLEANAAVGEDDDLLRLTLLAAHPALSLETGAALTLRLVLGVATGDIARLFLVSESTMAARLTRARKKVVSAGVPLVLPSDDVLPDRLDTVAQVAYLAFTSGYAPGSGPDTVRVDLAGEAIRLVSLLRGTSAHAGRHPGLTALLALMMLQHSRRDARTDAAGDIVVLAEQDRSRWRHDEIAEGLRLLETLVGKGQQGQPDGGAPRVALPGDLSVTYTLQALIAAEHATAGRAEDTDWERIAGYYAQLDALTGSPVVRLNRAIAVAESDGPQAGLDLLDSLDGLLPHTHRLPSIRADLLARAGRPEAAAEQYRIALDRCDNEPERRLLTTKRKRLDRR